MGAVVSMVTIGIFLITRIVATLRRAVQGTLPVDEIALIIYLKLLTFLDVIIVAVLFIAILIVLQRWNRDQEITIYASSGVGPASYLKTASYVIVLAVLVLAPLTLVMAPYAERIYYYELSNFRHMNDRLPFKPGKFSQSRDGSQVVYYGEGSDWEDSHSRLFQYLVRDNSEVLTIASNAELQFDEQAQLQQFSISDGKIYRFNENAVLESIQFRSYIQNSQLDTQGEFRIPAEGKSLRELYGSSKSADIGELYWRISKVAMIPLVILLAFTIGSIPMRRGVGVNLIASVIIYFTYSSLLGVSVDSIREGSTVAVYFMWLTHLTLAGLCIWVLFRISRNKSPFPNLFTSRV